MFLRRTLNAYHHHHFHTFLKHPNPPHLTKPHIPTSSIHLSTFSNVPKTSPTPVTPIPISLFQRNLSSCAQLVAQDVLEGGIEVELEPQKKKRKKKKKHVDKTKEKGSLEKEVKNGDEGVVELREKNEKNGVLKMPIDSKLKEIENLKKKLQKLENEVRGLNILKKKESKPTSLSALFSTNQKRVDSVDAKKVNIEKERVVVSKKERDSSTVKSVYVKKDRPVMKDLSPEMVALVSRFYEEGYLSKVKIEPMKEFDISFFANQCSRDLLKFQSEKFGKDHQEIAKWLSGSDLKKVTLFGCPSAEKRNVFAAKRLRTFFHIQEDIVCRACKLKNSCKYVNQRVWRKMETFNLADAVRVLISYSSDADPELTIPGEVKESISKLLKEVVNLSQ